MPGRRPRISYASNPIAACDARAVLAGSVSAKSLNENGAAHPRTFLSSSELARIAVPLGSFFSGKTIESAMTKIISIVPAPPGWFVKRTDDGGDFEMPVAVWALVEDGDLR